VENKLKAMRWIRHWKFQNLSLGSIFSTGTNSKRSVLCAEGAYLEEINLENPSSKEPQFLKIQP
jgi:hypothetical protein